MAFDDKTSVIDSRNFAAMTAEESEMRSACFTVIAGSQTGRMFKLDQEEMIIGRSVEAIIRIEDDGVSRRHAKILRQPDGTVHLYDLGSTNGTFCNGEKVEVRTLHDGDKLQIGTTTILKFSFQDSLEEDFQRRQYEYATRDSLTGCLNKKYFQERLPIELSFAHRHKKMLSLAMLDLDHFKKINDTYGHLAGDYVLRNVAKLMQQTIRADDTLVRYGGEEFALIMRETNNEKAFVAVERIREKIETAEFSFEGQSIPVTVSIGVATWDGVQTEEADALIRKADEQLYEAKHNGRNQTRSCLA